MTSILVILHDELRNTLTFTISFIVLILIFDYVVRKIKEDEYRLDVNKNLTPLIAFGVILAHFDC